MYLCTGSPWSNRTNGTTRGPQYTRLIGNRYAPSQSRQTEETSRARMQSPHSPHLDLLCKGKRGKPARRVASPPLCRGEVSSCKRWSWAPDTQYVISEQKDQAKDFVSEKPAVSWPGYGPVLIQSAHGPPVSRTGMPSNRSLDDKTRALLMSCGLIQRNRVSFAFRG